MEFGLPRKKGKSVEREKGSEGLDIRRPAPTVSSVHGEKLPDQPATWIPFPLCNVKTKQPSSLDHTDHQSGTFYIHLAELQQMVLSIRHCFVPPPP